MAAREGRRVAVGPRNAPGIHCSALAQEPVARNLLQFFLAATINRQRVYLLVRGVRLMKKITLWTYALAAGAFATNAFAGDIAPTPVPEPGTFGLLAAGIAAAVAVRLFKRK